MIATSPLLFLVLFSPAQASSMDTFGAGAACTSMGGGGIAYPSDSGSVFLNPASVVTIPTKNETLFSYQLVRSRFAEIPALWWDTNRDGRIDETDPPLDLQPKYNAGDGLLFATVHRLGRRVGVGASLFLPHDRILTLSTFEASLPYYPMFDSRLQFYAAVADIAVQPVRGLSLGGGGRMIPWVHYSIQASIDATVTSASEEDENALDLLTDLEVDVHSMNLRLTPAFAPFLGFYWDLGETIPPLRGLKIAGTWRGTVGLPVDVTGDVQINVHADDLGEIGSVLLPIVADIGLDIYDHYLPSQYVVGAGIQSVPWLSGYADLRFTRWSGMNINIAQISKFDLHIPLWEVEDDVVRDGNPYEIVFEDTWSWRGGLEVIPPAIPLAGRWDHLGFRFRVGGGIEPTPLYSQGIETALLDSDRIVLAGGLSAEHLDPFKGTTTVRWDTFCQVHKLVDDVLVRPMPEEPTEGYPREPSTDGSASLPIGGHVWTAGLQMDLRYGPLP